LEFGTSKQVTIANSKIESYGNNIYLTQQTNLLATLTPKPQPKAATWMIKMMQDVYI
jgi:hypothetical protein